MVTRCRPDRVPRPGDVGLDKRANCLKCGKRVAVTVRGLFATHCKPRPITRRAPLARRSQPIARKVRPRRVRKGKRARLKRLCDRLWSRIIRASNGGRCRLAGTDHVRCGGPLQAAHLFGRYHHGVRHSLSNGWPLCAGHHVYYTRNPEAWRLVLVQMFGGPEEYERRYLAAKVVAKPNYTAIAAELQSAVECL